MHSERQRDMDGIGRPNHSVLNELRTERQFLLRIRRRKLRYFGNVGRVETYGRTFFKDIWKADEAEEDLSHRCYYRGILPID